MIGYFLHCDFAIFTLVKDAPLHCDVNVWMKGFLELMFSTLICNVLKHPWNQQVVDVVFKKTSLQHLAGASRLSSPWQLPVIVISHSFSNTHTHTPRATHICTPTTAARTLPHLHNCTRLHTGTGLFFLSLCLFNNTTSSLTSCRSAPLSVLQRESLLWATQEQSNFLVH